MNFKDLDLKVQEVKQTIKFGQGKELTVRTYLPLAEKTSLIEYVVDMSLDQNTGRFSPVRVETFFSLAVAHYYAGIDFEDDVNAAVAYDALETSGLLDIIMSAIDEEELEFMKELVQDTVKDIADYNSSFAGIVRIASTDAKGLDDTVDTLLSKVRDKEGLELLSEIKNVVGKG